jgi:glycosyltransferase involved in cell wall biosynthesis
MRVAILSMYDFSEVRGGTELFVRYLQRVFRDSVNITYSKSRSEFLRTDLNRLSLEPLKRGIAISRKFAKMHREEDFDLVLCNDVTGLGLKLLEPSVPAIQVFHYTYKGFSAGTMLDKPGFFVSHRFLPLLERLTANGKRVVTVSHKARRELESLYGMEAQVIENGIDFEEFSPMPKDEARARLGLKEGGPVGLFVGRADHTKGFDVVQALARTRQDIRILCVTSSAPQDKDLMLARNVPNEMMPVYYSAADFLIFPSRYESAGYAVIEALACNLPVVANRTGLLEDMPEEDVGQLVDAVSVEAFSKGIDALLHQGPMNTRARAQERFSLERFARDYTCLAESVVAEWR